MARRWISSRTSRRPRCCSKNSSGASRSRLVRGNSQSKYSVSGSDRQSNVFPTRRTPESQTMDRCFQARSSLSRHHSRMIICHACSRVVPPNATDLSIRPQLNPKVRGEEMTRDASLRRGAMNKRAVGNRRDLRRGTTAAPSARRRLVLCQRPSRRSCVGRHIWGRCNGEIARRPPGASSSAPCTTCRAAREARSAGRLAWGWSSSWPPTWRYSLRALSNLSTNGGQRPSSPGHVKRGRVIAIGANGPWTEAVRPRIVPIPCRAR